jgi:glycosyltransferase involved in cell wall biosynthesis
VASVIQNSDLVFILNRITLDAIVKREHYGPMPLEKFHYFPHPVRNNLNGSEDNRNRIAEMFGIETDPNKEGYRVISASVGLISPEKGLDKLIDSIVMAQNNRNLLPTKFKDTGLHFVVGSGHPNHKLRLAEGNPERTDDAWREWLFNTLGKKLNDGTIPWLYCPGQKEAIEADLSKYSFVFIDHFMAEHEFRNWLVLPHIGIITNQDSQQTSSGPIAEYGTLRTLLATHSLASEQQLLPIPYRIGEEIGAEERDSGWLIELGKNYTKYLAQAYSRAVANTDLRNWKEARAIDKREEQTYKTLTKTKIDLIESLL